MCELCGSDQIKIRRLRKDELDRDDLCEWLSDPEDGPGEVDPEGLDEFEASEMGCVETPRWLVTIGSVDEHLCQQHADLERAEQEKGLGAFLTEAGFDAGELRPIKSKEVCEHLDLVNPGDCDQPAKFAKWVCDEILLCDEHVKEFR